MAIDLHAPTSDVERVLSAASRAHASRPRVAVVAGSGLASLADLLGPAERVPYRELEGFSAAGKGADVPGHAGELLVDSVSGVPVALFAGRAHLYQGVSALDAAYPARLAAAIGCEVLVLTNAAGAVAQDLHTGDIVLISDHMNLTGANPVSGWAGPDGGTPFVPMAGAWDGALRALALDGARELALPLREGVYAAVPGPTYETPAEVRALRVLGADVVGMSTVPEAIAGRALGLRLLGLSIVTNAAGGRELDHAHVLETSRAAAEAVGRLLAAILSRL